MDKVLVAYASKHGATEGIARRIGEVLRSRGLQADVLPVEQVADVGAYGAVVLGSAVYMGQWRQEAAEFLTRYTARLAERPTWLFSSGPTGEGDASALMKGWRFPEKLQPAADQIKPRDIVFLHGVIDSGTLSFPEKLMVKGVKAPQGDYRDWQAIEDWADGIAAALTR